jgi:AGZA family xanthine/uracil permease-like MFS transporter
MTGLRARVEAYFEFPALSATWRTEILAGCTTFMTMAYIIFVNPSILHETGMPIGAVTVATCLAAAFGSLLMGLLARYPIALAPGMGLNAYFTYSVVKGMGVPWQTALGAVFLSGVAFLLLTLTGARQLIIGAVPPELYAAVAAGVGLFIALIGLRNSGIITANSATLVSLGNLRSPNTLLALFGLLLMAVLLARNIQAGILIGIVATTLAGALTGLVHWQPQTWHVSDLGATAFHLDILSAAKLGALEIVFAFLFVDLFDNIGTLVAVGEKAGLIRESGQIPRLNQIFYADSAATIFGSLTGTSTVVSYIESSAGVAAGGRTGITAIVTGLLFLAAIPVAPIAGAIPTGATAPALIIVGSLMMSSVAAIRWADPAVAIPAFLTLVTIPLTYSIANGLAFGFTAYALIRIVCGEFRKVNWFVYVLVVLFIARFYYLGKGT